VSCPSASLTSDPVVLSEAVLATFSSRSARPVTATTEVPLDVVPAARPAIIVWARAGSSLSAVRNLSLLKLRVLPSLLSSNPTVAGERLLPSEPTEPIAKDTASSSWPASWLTEKSPLSAAVLPLELFV
jgi:hypothetical protein